MSEPATDRKVSLGFVHRMKQGDLLRVMVERGWSQKELGLEIGLNDQQAGKLINLTRRPKMTRAGEHRLMELTGKTLDDICPMEVVVALAGRPRSAHTYHDVTLLQLSDGHMDRLALPSHEEEIISAHDAKALIGKYLNQIPKKPAHVLRLRFFDDLSLTQVAKVIGLSRERVRQLETSGLRKLQHLIQANNKQPATPRQEGINYEAMERWLNRHPVQERTAAQAAEESE